MIVRKFSNVETALLERSNSVDIDYILAKYSSLFKKRQKLKLSKTTLHKSTVDCYTMSPKANENADKKQQKKKHRDKSDLGPNFVAPDGGWGWVVCFAVGFANLSVFPTIQQFGLIFRDRLLDLGISNSKVTTLININSALGAFSGLLNGPMFRRFTYRQVSLAGATLVFTGLLLTAFCSSFPTYLITYSVLYGTGFGITMSANSLALNTYFKLKRRTATGISWTVTSLGPVIMPYVVTGLLSLYGVTGTVLMFSCLSLHAIAGALTLQPVQWHTDSVGDAKKSVTDLEQAAPEHLCNYCRMQSRRASSVFSSQYLYNADDSDMTGYEIIDPGTPMMSRANDGWFSSERSASKLSLASKKGLNVNNNFGNSHSKMKRNFSSTSSRNYSFAKAVEADYSSRPNTFSREREGQKYDLHQRKCTCEAERQLLRQAEPIEESEISDRENYSLMRKIAIFFDLDLLRDPIYVVLMIGLTFANFTEMNFSILTPFIMSDFGYTKPQIALMMSLLGGMDTGVRFLIPFVAEKIGWDNRTLYLIGVVGMALGRIVIAHFRNFTFVLAAASLIGIGKALRTVFAALVIPSHVELKRLPAASGLQLLFSGIFTTVAGPIVGLIRDNTDYVITLHCLNILTFSTAISWTLERIITRRRKHCTVSEEINEE